MEKLRLSSGPAQRHRASREQDAKQEFIDSEFKGVTVIQIADKFVCTFDTARKQFIEHLIDALVKTSPGNDLDILDCFDAIFNPVRYPGTETEQHLHSFYG
ncbi:Hypothetical protein SMAX5B_008685 [Scophthalmus maximus]|uniref:Uncharacterized protein n=1 Tax=Scophthalmus maximus TaxID=52904 RepID=A0A2U9CRG1_SCOMX|nr:Hypothetical protein SMAX5B_008685 [Scophthalmus maximus]KAF0032917.1 hypothetical protein F2P81_015207 [Scophthalmus maximus]